MPRFTALAVILTAVACGDGDTRSHPSNLNILLASEVDTVVTRTSTASAELSMVASGLARARETDRSPSLKLRLERIADASTSHLGELVLWDDGLGQIVTVDQALDRVEYWQPSSVVRLAAPPSHVDASQSGLLVLVDRHKQVLRFRKEAGAWVALETIHTPVVAESVCMLASAIVVQGWSRRGATLHVVPFAGGPVRSFGREYVDPQDFIRAQLSDGLVACLPDKETVVTMLDLLPYVFGYNSAGAVKWVTRIDGFVPMKTTSYLERGRPVLSRDAEPEHHVPVTLLPITPTVLLLQFAQRRGKEPEVIQSYLLSSDTGTGGYVGGQLPRVIAAAGRYLYAAASNPLRIQQLEWGAQ